MENNKIILLIEKYFDDETSLQEESIIRDYFNQTTELSSGLKVYEPFFKGISEEKAILAPSNLEDNVLKVIESKSKVVSINKETKVRSIFPTLLRIASVLVVIASVYFVTQQSSKTASGTMVAQAEDTYETPQEAYDAYKKAIAMASRKMKKGEDKLQQEMAHVRVLTNIVK